MAFQIIERKHTHQCGAVCLWIKVTVPLNISISCNVRQQKFTRAFCTTKLRTAHEPNLQAASDFLLEITRRIVQYCNHEFRFSCFRVSTGASDEFLFCFAKSNIVFWNYGVTLIQSCFSFLSLSHLHERCGKEQHFQRFEKCKNPDFQARGQIKWLLDLPLTN